MPIRSSWFTLVALLAYDLSGFLFIIMKLIRNSLTMKNFKKGFTLIELLVVISIIALLSSVALASLRSARAKVADASIKSNLVTVRTQSNIYFDANGNYSGFLNNFNSTQTRAFDAARAIVGGAGYTSGTADWWFAVVPLKSDSSIGWCVDSTQASRSVVLAGFDGTETSCAEI